MQNDYSPEAVYAVARIFGDRLDFDAVTRAVGRSPSEVRRKGDMRPTGTAVSQDVWMLEAPLPKSAACDSHLRWLRGALTPAYEFLRAWIHESEVSIYCGISIDGDSCTFMLSSEALKLFVELDTPFDLSLIFTGYLDSELETHERGLAKPTYPDVSLRFEVDSALAPAGVATRLEAAALQSGSRSWEPVGKTGAATSLFITPAVHSNERLDVHFRWIHRFISQNADTIRELNATSTHRPVVCCSFATQRDQDTIAITSGALRSLTEMEFQVEFSIKLV